MNTILPVITQSDYRNILIQKRKIIDVRAAIEFEQGAVPGSVNLPILNNEERHRVGELYKLKGNEAAVKLGYELVSGANKEKKIQDWISEIKKNTEILITCFRGGQRSQISQKWLSELGYDIPRFEKGYKHYRAWIIQELKNFSSTESFRVLSGTTGSGKTKLLKKLKLENSCPVVDLEGLANHKGSAFGKELTEQPSQADFENRLWQDILIEQDNFKNKSSVNKNILFEDESRMIGKRHLTEEFFTQLRQGPIILMNIPLEQRIDHIFYDYVTNTNIIKGKKNEALAQFDKYIENTKQISKRLGGLRASEICADIETSKTDFLVNNQFESNKLWIEKLLVWYYDPLYLSSLKTRDPKIEFQGSETEIADYLTS